MRVHDADDREVDVALPARRGEWVASLRQRRDGQSCVTLRIVRDGRVIAAFELPSGRDGRRGDRVDVRFRWERNGDAATRLVVELSRGEVATTGSVDL